MYPSPSLPAAPDPGIPYLLSMAGHSRLSQPRWEQLLADLPVAVDKLWRRRAAEVPEQDLDDYVTLQWMSWNCGALMLTPNGRSLLDMVVARTVSA
jgi:hypothetical protein